MCSNVFCVFSVGGGKALQRQKNKKKANLKELNRRGQEKEGGSDMDAFTSLPPTPATPNVSATTVEVKTTSPSPPSVQQPEVVVPPQVQPPVIEQAPVVAPTPVIVQKQQQQQAPITDKRVPTPATIIPPPISNKNIDNEVCIHFVNTIYIQLYVCIIVMSCILSFCKVRKFSTIILKNFNYVLNTLL